MTILADFLETVAKDLPKLETQVNTALAPAGTSLPALGRAVTGMLHDVAVNPGQTLPQVLVDGAQIVFAANPLVSAGIMIGYALFASGVAKPADQAFFDALDKSKGEGNPYT